MVGILAFGSLQWEPGCEIKASVVDRYCETTPFRVEFARYSSSRGEAPTLVPVNCGGEQVKAELLVLDESVSLCDAKNMLYRREIHTTNTNARYMCANSTVHVKKYQRSERPETVIYTDFRSGKISNPNPRELAQKAIESVAKAKPEQDGITYLMKAIEQGIKTPLTSVYKSQILDLTCTHTLVKALQQVRAKFVGTS
jgi:hypothetical protein